MCGIVGTIGETEVERVERAAAALSHRGPDAGAVQSYICGQRRIVLGHRRLSILDLSHAADQPFTSACGNFVLIYNGEIYNHDALRVELAQEGCAFATRSDTEVLLNGLIRHGADFLARANGMFAFAMLDMRAGRLTLGRDPFGIKPLYVMDLPDGGIAFASELKSLQIAAGRTIQPDPECFAEFLLNGFLHEPKSGFRGVSKVPQGSTVEVNLATMQAAEKRFHDPLAMRSAHEPLEVILSRQIGMEMLADVPVGVFFSGGIDSAALVAAAPGRVEALYVDYGEDEGGDAHYAAAVAKALNTPLRRVEHRHDALDVSGILAEFRDVASGNEEPISDFTFAATRLLSRYAREAGYKVMLSGMGGDELFAGYPRHAAARYWSVLRAARGPLAIASPFLRRSPRWDKKIGRLESFLSARDFIEAYVALVGYFSAPEVAALLGNAQSVELALDRARQLVAPVRNRSPLRQAMYLDRQGYLAHNLTVTDRASMAESIEVRVPLLNTAAESLGNALADRELVARGRGKLPLKRYLSDRLDPSLIHRPKVGFNPPLDGRIRQLGRGCVTELLSQGAITQHLDGGEIRTIIDDHFTGLANNTYRLWQLIYFGMWLDGWTASAYSGQASP